MSDNTRMRPELLRPALLIVVAIALIFFLGSPVLELFGNRMLYPRPPWPVPSPPPEPLEEVVLESATGRRIMAWGRSGVEPSGSAILFFHGNGENLETLRLSGLFEEAAAIAGYVLAVDYPGYGRSDGSPSEASLIDSGRVGLDWLGERHPRLSKVVVGWSLGAAVAIQVAASTADGKVDRLVLLSPWDDLPTLASSHFPTWLVRLGLADRYDSRAAAARIEVPTLIVHGGRDRIIPIARGARLHEAFAPGRARFVRLDQAGHNDLLGRHRVWEELRSFVDGEKATP